jgi:hypothetical protein
MLEWSAILACMPLEYSSAMPDPDEFDQQLRDLTSGQAEPAKFTELSAAERARRRESSPPPTSAKMNRRNTRKARELRRPVGDTGPKPAGSGPKRAGSGKTRRPRPPSGNSTPRIPNAKNRRRQRVLAIARTVGILVAFAALLYGLHLLGFGPQ